MIQAPKEFDHSMVWGQAFYYGVGMEIPGGT
jgi:hypothetical protein